MDYTQLETLQRCEMEFVNRHVRHLVSPEESLATFFGRVVHEGVRVFYEAEKAGSGGVVGWRAPQRDTNGADAAQALVPPADRAAAACLAYWQREVESGRVVLAQPAAGKPDHRTPQLAAAIVRVYASLYGNRMSRGYDVVMNERYLEARNAAECGIIDRVVRRHADGLLYVLDLKTSSWAPNKGYWRQWGNSQQAAIYVDLVEAALGEAPAGFWCDHIYVSGRKDGPRPEDFMQFGPVAYSAEKRAELREQRVQWRALADHLRALPTEALQSTRSCFRFNTACPYLDYCMADPADREAMVQRDLQVGTVVDRPWDPAERDK